MDEVDEFGIPIKKTATKKQAVDEFGIPIKKKGSSEPTAQEKSGVSPTRPTTQGISSDTEPPTRAQASVALGGPTKLFGQEEEKRPTSIMYGNEPKKEGFVPPSTPIDIDQSIKYLEKKKSNPKELKRLKEEKARMPEQKPIEYYLNKQIVNNLTPAIDQANTITEEDKSERDSEFENDWNKTGFVNKLKQFGSDILGSSVNLFNKLGFIDESMTEEDTKIEPLKKYKDEVIKEATENKVKLSPEQFKIKVQEKYNNDWDTDKKAYNLTQLNYTLTDEEQKAIREDKFDNYKDLNTSQKYFLNTASTLSNVRDNIGLDLVSLDKELSEKIKNGVNPTENEIQSYNNLIEKYKKYHLDAQNAYGKYAKNLDKVHSLETELDVFDNENFRSLEFLKRLGIGVEQLGVGIIDFTSYLANLHAKSSPLNSSMEISMYLHKKANDLRGAIEEQNKGLRDTSNRFESVLSNSVDFITENTPMVLGLVYGGAPAMFGLAGTTAGEKYGEMLNEDAEKKKQISELNKKLESGELDANETDIARQTIEDLSAKEDYNEFQEVVAPLLHGGAMLIPLSKQLKTIQNSGRVLLAGEKEFPKIIENVYKEKAANLFGKIKTFAGESFDLGNQLKLMTILQEVNNSVVLGKDVDYKKLLDLEVYATAPLLHGMNKVAPYLAGKVTEPFMSKEDYKIIDENTSQIFDLNKKLESGELDINEADIVKQTIKDLSAKSADVVNNKLDRIGKYSKETVDNILDATKQASDLREKANRIISSENIDAKQKKVVIEKLRGEYNSIEQTKSELISGNAKKIIYVKKATDIPIESERVKGAQYKVVENSIEKKLFEKQQMSVNAPAVEVTPTEVKAEEITTTEVTPTDVKAEEVKPAEENQYAKASFYFSKDNAEGNSEPVSIQEQKDHDNIIQKIVDKGVENNDSAEKIRDKVYKYLRNNGVLLGGFETFGIKEYVNGKVEGTLKTDFVDYRKPPPKPKEVEPTEAKAEEVKPAIESPIELKEGEELVDVKQDKKGNTYTYVAETSEKDGVKTTKFKFNRSDKSSEQRSPTGVDADKVLDKYGYEIPADEIPEGAEIIEINEIREGEKTTGATVTFKHTETGNRFKGEIVLKPKAKEAKAEETKTVNHNGIEYTKNDAGNWVNTKTGNEIKGIGDKGKELIKTLDDLAKTAEVKEIVAPKEDLTAGKGLFSEPVEHVIKTAEDYKKSKGITVDAGERITDIDVENSKKIADAYDEMQSNPNDPEVKVAYNAMANETMDQFKYLIDNGYTVELYDGKTEPYKNSEEMLKDLRDNKHLYVFSTEEGFGDTPITEKDRQENPLLKDSGFTDKNGKKLLINDAFRFVHDIFGHGERGNSFGAKGEENAWDVHSRMYSPEARRAMTTETRGQNSWVNFNKEMRNEDGSIKNKGDKGYLSPTERPFADQKIGLLPEWVSKSIYETAEKPTEPAKKYADRAKELADKVRNSDLPDWAKANIEGGKKQGVDANTMKEALAKAIEKTGELMDKGVEFAEAIKEAVKEMVDLLGEDKRASIEKDFSDYYNSIKEPITEEPKKENIVKKTVKSFFENDIAPMFKTTAEAAAETIKAVVNTLSPKTGVGKEVVTKFYELVGDRNKATTFISKQVGEYKKTFDKMPDSERIDFIDRMKAGKPQATPELDDIAKVISKLDKDLYDEITKYNPNLAWKENHFRVLWKKVPGTDKEKYWSFLSKRPIRGSRGFFGQSTLRSMSEGIEKGGVPYSTNPIEMFEMSYNDGMKYVTAQRIIDAFKKDGIIKFVKSGQDVPDGYTKINDSVANVYFKTDQGMVKTGEYWIQEDPGRMLNNMLSRDYIRDTKLGTSLMGIKNFYTAIELGLSPFHAVAISLEQIASGAGIGLRKIVNLGDIKGGIKDVLTAPFSPKTTFSLGRKYFKFATAKEFENSPEGKSFLQKNPRAKEYLDDFFQGGGLAKQHEDLKNNAYKALKESMGKDNYIGAALRALPALNEGVMDPLFNVYIPSLKIGLFMKEFPLILAENKSRLDSGKVTREELSRKTIDGIDNRLGEMNFDNLYWNKTFKTSMQFMLRSVTWKLGNIRQMGGAAPEQAIEFVNAVKENRRPNLSPKMAWLFGLSLTQVVLASVIQGMYLDDDDKDKDIKDFKDIVAPRINSSDNKERIVIPTYYKDLLHFWHAPTEYVSSGVSGPFGKGIDLYNNEDFYKYNIYDETDPVYKQLIDAGKYAAPKPFSITSAQKMKEKGEPVSKQALSFMGFNKAPGYLEHSDLESEILDLYSIRNTSIKPLKMKEANDKKKEIREMYKKDIGKAQEMANEAVKEGLLRPTQVTRLFRDVAKNEDAMVFFFKRLPESDKEYLATKMTEEEKKKFNIKKKLTDAEFKEKYGEKAFKQLLRGRELLKKGAN
jgi:hypothetical protein